MDQYSPKLKGEAIYMANAIVFLVNFLSILIGGIMITSFLRIAYDVYPKKTTKLLFLIIFSLVNGFISTIMPPVAYKPILLLIVGVFCTKLLLKTKLLQAFVALSFYIIGLAIGDSFFSMVISYTLSGILLKNLKENIFLWITGNVAANAIAFILFLIIRPFKSFIRVAYRNKFLYVLTAFTILVVTSSIALHYYMDAFNLLAYVIISIVIISYCIFTILIWFSTLKKAINEEELAQQKFYNESIRSTLFDLRRFKHDWVNNLTVIYSMLKMNKIKELNQYVSELIVQNTEHSNTEIFNIKNAGLFGIISSKINQAKEKGISVELSVIGEVENIPGVKISELCEIVGIFLDNAIEEALKSDKSISIVVYKSEKCIELSISNSCQNAPDIQSIYLEGFSTKGENRGMGLAIAKKILEKYKNILHRTSYEDNIFTQTLEISEGKG